MNIWSLQKHESIKLVLLLLQKELGTNSFTILDKEELDHRAIRLSKPGNKSISAYLFTYGQNEERYGLYLEMPSFDENEISDTIQIEENLTLSRLVDILCVHFDVLPIPMEDGVSTKQTSRPNIRS